MTKENMIVLALSGVLLMVVAIPTGKEKNKTDESKSVQLDTQTVTMDSESNSAQQEAMEEKLAQFLSRMEGAGRVEVLITYASTEEQVIEKEMPSVTNSQTSENDAGGTSRRQRDAGPKTFFALAGCVRLGKEKPPLCKGGTAWRSHAGGIVKPRE